MPEDDPFADLGETLEADPDDASGDETAAASGSVDDQTGNDGDDTATASEDPTDPEPHDPVSDAAFSYEAAKQRPFYARETTIQAFDSWLNYELERELADRGYRNVVVREMTDALLRTVVQENLVDDVAERFERAREGDERDADD